MKKKKKTKQKLKPEYINEIKYYLMKSFKAGTEKKTQQKHPSKKTKNNPTKPTKNKQNKKKLFFLI